jgi:hypothetical protein
VFFATERKAIKRKETQEKERDRREDWLALFFLSFIILI